LQHRNILPVQIQHVSYAGPRNDHVFQPGGIDAGKAFNDFPDAVEQLALMVRDLLLVGPRGIAIPFGFQPEPFIDLRPGDDCFGITGKQFQQAEGHQGQDDLNAPVKNQRLPNVQKQDGWIGDNFPQVFVHVQLRA